MGSPALKEPIEQLAPYQQSGVNTNDADLALRRAAKVFRKTWPDKGRPGEVQLDFRYFANVIEVGGVGVALCTDGVGSKAMIAQMMGQYDTIGIDCVAMNVNDLICVGARPVSFVDYIAVSEIDGNMFDEIARGLRDGAEEAGVSISGGETAQLPDMIHGAPTGVSFDLVGTAIGHVNLDELIVGKNLQDGDAVIGVESNGIHANGLTLARGVFFEKLGFSIGKPMPEFEGCTIGEELLRPTHIYVKEFLSVLNSDISIKACVHITSDGFMNLTRVAADKVGFVIDDLPDIPPVFKAIMEHGPVKPAEMFHVYNMGIGFCVVVEKADAARALNMLSSHGRAAHVIGRVTTDHPRQVHLTQHGLMGKGKTFHPVFD